MVDDIDAAIGRRRTVSVYFAFDSLKRFETALAGRRVARVAARGKAVLVFFEGRGDDGSWCVYSHNQLYGRWHIGPPDAPPNTNRQLRFAVRAKSRAAYLYSASDIRVVRPAALDGVAYLARLGIDPLNQDIALETLAGRLADRRFARRALGNLLLDQGFVAGIGNYLRSEILFEAGIDPGRRAADLSNDRLESLAAAIDRLIERAYRLKGVTNDPDRATRLEREGASFGRRRHMVFGRAGHACYICNTAIEKTRYASRRLYLCPRCQR